VEHFQELGSLASRCRAKIQNNMARLDIQQQGGNHADYLLSTNVPDACLRHQELLEFREGRVTANDVLGGGHPPGKVLGVPGNRARRLDRKTIVVGQLRDLGDITLLEEALHCEGMAVKSLSV
jgi:hypothetical protein